MQAALRIFPLIGLGFLAIRLMKSAAGPLDNSDTWFHLRLGREFWGPWALTNPGQPTKFATSDWVPTQWSTEMVASRFESWFGLPGVAWLFGLIFLLFLVALYLSCRAEGAPLPATVATGMAIIASAPSISARPQVVSLTLLAVATWAWLRTTRDLKARWWLVPMTWGWATAHGLWSAAIILGAVCWLGLVLDRRLSRRQAVHLLGVPALSLMAAALTPVGPRLLLSQLAVSQRSSMIGEWAPTSFRAIPAFTAALMLGGVVVLWARRSERISWTPLLLLALAAGWTMLITRMVAVGAVIAAPLLASALQNLMPRRATIRARTERLAIIGGAVVCLLGLALAVPHTSARPGKVPTALSGRLAALPPGSVVLVEDGVGAWIEWRFPSLNPVIDGMFDAYPVSYMKDFADARSLEPGWQHFVRRSGAQVAVLPKHSAFGAAVRHELGWRVVQEGKKWLYLEAPTNHGR